MTMNENVDIFAKNIRADPKLAGGFNCVGFSQGNSLCRGYVPPANNPSKDTQISPALIDVGATLCNVTPRGQPCDIMPLYQSLSLWEIYPEMKGVGWSNAPGPHRQVH